MYYISILSSLQQQTTHFTTVDEEDLEVIYHLYT